MMARAQGGSRSGGGGDRNRRCPALCLVFLNYIGPSRPPLSVRTFSPHPHPYPLIVALPLVPIPTISRLDARHCPLSRRNAPKTNAHWGGGGKRAYGVWTSAALDATAPYRLKPLVFLCAITTTLHLLLTAVLYVLPPTTRTNPRRGAGAGR